MGRQPPTCCGRRRLSSCPRLHATTRFYSQRHPGPRNGAWSGCRSPGSCAAARGSGRWQGGWPAWPAGWLAFAHGILAQAPQRPGQLSPLPLTQLDERTTSPDLDNRTLSLTVAEPAPIKDVLLRLVRGTNLSILPDPTMEGTFTGELKNVTVRQALDLMLEPRGLGFEVDGPFVRVFRREPETRLFDINYIATDRVGTATVGAAGDGRSSASVASTTKTDIFADLAVGVRALLSDRA